MDDFSKGHRRGFFKDMNDSAVNFSAYRNFAGHPWRRVIGYLVLLVLLLGTPVLLSFVYDFNREVDRLAEKFSREAPDFLLKNGELQVFGEMPLILEDERGGSRNIIVVDTSGETDESILQDYENGVFVSKTKIVQKNSLETQIFYFSNFKDLTVTKEDVLEWLPSLKLTAVFIVLFGFIYFFLAKLCTAAVSGLLCLLFSRLQQRCLTYGQGVKISVYALTIPTLLQALQAVILPGFFAFGLLYYIVLTIYLWFGVQSGGEAA